MRLFRVLFSFLGWILILVLLTLGGIVALATTEQGTRWVLDQAARHAPIELAVENVEGTLFRGLSLSGLRLDAGGTQVHLTNGRIQVEARSLLRLTLRIRELTLSGLRVDLPVPATDPREPSTPFELPDAVELPLSVLLDRVSLKELRLLRAGEPMLELDRIALRLEADAQSVRLSDLRVEMQDTEAELNAEVLPSGDFPLQIDGHWRVLLPEALATGLDTTHAAGALTARGVLRGRIRIEHRLEAGAALDTHLLLEDLLETPKIALQNRWAPFDYRTAPERVIGIDAGELNLAGQLDDWNLEALASVRLDELPPTQISATLAGSTRELAIEALRLRSDDGGRIDLTGRIGFDQTVDWQLQAVLRELSSQMLGLEPDLALEVFSVVSEGVVPLIPDATLEDWLAAIDGSFRIEELQAEALGQRFAGRGELRVHSGVALVEHLHLTQGEQGRLQLDGEAELGLQTAFRLSLAADAIDLAFLLPDRAVSVDRLRLGATGTLAAETGAFSAEVALPELNTRVDGEPIGARAALVLTETAADISELSVFLPAGGLLSATGQIGYGTGIEWDVQATGHGIDPSTILPDLYGRMALDLRSRGTLPPDATLQAEVELTELRGTLRGQPLEGIANVTLRGSRVQVDRADLSMGANRLSATGTIDEHLDFSLVLDAPELDRILPDLDGRLRLDARLGGTLESPTVIAQGDGTGLRFGTSELDALSLRVDAGLDPEAPAELALRLAGARVGATRIEALSADVQGRASQHQLALSVDATDMGRVDLRALGGYDLDRSRWDGQLVRLNLSQPLAGDWSLQEPARISADPKRARLDPVCVGREASRICANGEWAVASGAQMLVSIQDLDLAWLSPFLPPATAIDGRLSARAEATRDPDARLRAELVIPPAAGTLRFELTDGTPQTVPFTDLQLTARIVDRAIEATAGLSFLEDGELSTRAQLRPDGDRYQLAARVQAGLESLGWAGALSPAIQDVHGRLRADIELGGHLDDPTISGGIRLEEAGVTIPEAGIQLEIPLLQADAVAADALRLAGEIRSGRQPLSLEGELGFEAQRPRAEIRIRGQRFLAVDRPDIRARVSPDLVVSFVPEQLTVRGDVEVPSALIRPPDLPPGAIAVSRDEVVVGEEQARDTGLPIDIRIRVILGDDVRFEGFDLEARVTGDLDVVDLPGRPLQVFGNVEIPEGRYEAWGQDLRLERGLVIFQGPVENPLLDLRAVRRVPAYDVVVGVEIGGTPDTLQSRVTSEPPMDDTEAMAFLLTGRPMAGMGEGDGNLIANAAAAWGLEQAGLISQRLGSELGLEVEFDVADDLDQSAMTIGTYLSPRLLMRYTVGLFDGTSRIMMRYELTRSLSVETTSGADSQGIDLIYRIER